VRRAAQIFTKATVDEQNQIARALSVELGSIVVDKDRKLSVGPPKPPVRRPRRDLPTIG
jgi:hypothetical protein